MSIDRYLMLSMIRGGVPILGLLLGLFAFLTLAEELEDVGKGNFEVIDALNVMVYSLPKISLELLPVTSLIGVLVGLGTLGNQQELIALRAAGWSNRVIPGLRNGAHQAPADLPALGKGEVQGDLLRAPRSGQIGKEDVFFDYGFNVR